MTNRATGKVTNQISIAKIKKEGLTAFKESLFECVKVDSNRAWTDTFTDLAMKGHRIKYVLTDSPWIEVDTKEDYEEAKRLFGTR